MYEVNVGDHAPPRIRGLASGFPGRSGVRTVRGGRGRSGSGRSGTVGDGRGPDSAAAFVGAAPPAIEARRRRRANLSSGHTAKREHHATSLPAGSSESVTTGSGLSLWVLGTDGSRAVSLEVRRSGLQADRDLHGNVVPCRDALPLADSGLERQQVAAVLGEERRTEDDFMAAQARR